SRGNKTDLAPTARFETPDDDNAEDRTVWVVTLPRAVEPGETVSVDLTWRAKIPRTFARTGFRGDYFFLAHWFPKLGVFEGRRG
ncbi:MAG: M1 family peptidase, partial [Acidobacteria bacterium]|nr:M1 family peptidase [Acidobacteriota bacterium]NIM61295.1 M1 family peptidase [Acidobacteriota bacterium]NIO58763.1 M1 family peptidase [Acidobacteriota bacterium]NIQ29806.1 M1 family peptidase [Acidobacteriota bacterium]NIQ84529.1 M1 family peptidase [Acidobacteriota bacterium]